MRAGEELQGANREEEPDGLERQDGDDPDRRHDAEGGSREQEALDDSLAERGPAAERRCQCGHQLPRAAFHSATSEAWTSSGTATYPASLDRACALAR